MITEAIRNDSDLIRATTTLICEKPCDLFIPACEGDLDTFAGLISAGKYTEDDYDAAYIYAAMNNRVGIIDFIKNSIGVRSSTISEMAAAAAVMVKRWDGCHTIVTGDGVDINFCNGIILRHAVVFGSIGNVQFCISNGADMSLLDEGTILMAGEVNNQDTLEYLGDNLKG